MPVPMRIGVIGAGTMGRIHAAALSTIEGVSMVAIGTRSAPPAAAELAREHHAELLSTDHLLTRTDIDTVVIATPTDTHLDLVRSPRMPANRLSARSRWRAHWPKEKR
jgi:myo-inositol 2-dehydrogenase/D-chiro-inositol 1-dehydrogenase